MTTTPAPAHRVPPRCSAPGCPHPGSIRLAVGATTLARFCAIHLTAGCRHALAQLDHDDEQVST